MGKAFIRGPLPLRRRNKLISIKPEANTAYSERSDVVVGTKTVLMQAMKKSAVVFHRRAETLFNNAAFGGDNAILAERDAKSAALPKGFTSAIATRLFEATL